MTEGDDEFGPLRPQPKSWEDVHEMTGGLKDVPIEEIERGRHDWEYHFSSADMRKCGRLGCEQEHAHGWIVALRGRRYVNIGNCCFRKYARPDLFSSGAVAHRERRQEEARVSALLTVVDEAQRKLHWIDNAPEISLAIARIESFSAAATGPFLREIERRAEKMETRVTREVRLTDEQMEVRQEMQRGARASNEPGPFVSRFETQDVGHLTGLSCFRMGRDPKTLRNRLQTLARTLLSWKPKAEDKDARRAMSKAMREFGPYTNDLIQSVRATEQFFSESNLRIIKQLPVVRSQGIASIEFDDGGAVRITRLPHWNKAA